MSNLDERARVRLPADLADELRAATLCLACAESNLRAPVSTTIHASDATPATAGVCEARVSRDLCHALFDHAEHRGEYPS